MLASFTLQGSTIALARPKDRPVDLFRVGDKGRAEDVCTKLRLLAQLGALGVSPDGFLTAAGVPLYGERGAPAPFDARAAPLVRAELFAIGPGAKITEIEPASKVDVGAYETGPDWYGLALMADGEIVYKSGRLMTSRGGVVLRARDLRDALVSGAVSPGVSIASPYNLVLRGVPAPFPASVPFVAFGESLRAAGRIHAAAKAFALLAGASRYRRTLEPEVGP